MTKMVKAIEKDKSQGRYIIWLRFTPALPFQDCNQETVKAFLNGELLLIYTVFQKKKTPNLRQ